MLFKLRQYTLDLSYELQADHKDLTKLIDDISDNKLSYKNMDFKVMAILETIIVSAEDNILTEFEKGIIIERIIDLTKID